VFEAVISNVKKSWEKSQAEKKRRDDIYKEAYKTAEKKALQEKAARDAAVKYAPPTKVSMSPKEAKKRAEAARRMNPFGRY
jgi:hypothetical protein